jgi:hypothetical protein
VAAARHAEERFYARRAERTSAAREPARPSLGGACAPARGERLPIGRQLDAMDLR